MAGWHPVLCSFTPRRARRSYQTSALFVEIGVGTSLKFLEPEVHIVYLFQNLLSPKTPNPAQPS